jgi:holo-[acyl-carrier protein] synthase
VADDLDKLSSDIKRAGDLILGSQAVRIGVDLVEISRIASALERPSFATRCFTDAERSYCDAATNSAERYAVRFSAKEAVLKALGVGLGGVAWHDIEVIRLDSGEPSLMVSGRGTELAESFGITNWLITMTHSKSAAHALVVGLGRHEGD